jgi:hypothetical protein
MLSVCGSPAHRYDHSVGPTEWTTKSAHFLAVNYRTWQIGLFNPLVSSRAIIIKQSIFNAFSETLTYLCRERVSKKFHKLCQVIRLSFATWATIFMQRGRSTCTVAPLESSRISFQLDHCKPQICWFAEEVAGCFCWYN